MDQNDQNNTSNKVFNNRAKNINILDEIKSSPDYNDLSEDE